MSFSFYVPLRRSTSLISRFSSGGGRSWRTAIRHRVVINCQRQSSSYSNSGLHPLSWHSSKLHLESGISVGIRHFSSEEPGSDATEPWRDVSHEQLKEMLASGNIFLVDVRESHELAETGKIDDRAVHIPRKFVDT